MTPEPLTETADNERIVLRMFRAGADTLEIARKLSASEAQIARMLGRARRQEAMDKHLWQQAVRS